MKKLFLVCFAAMLGFMNAQETTEVQATGLKGAWWGMGTLSYEFNDDTDASAFTIMPIAGTFISPTVTVGAGIGFESTNPGDVTFTDPTTGSEVTVEGESVDYFTIMPLARKYWGVADNLYIFGQAAVPMRFGDDVNTIGFQLAPGIDYFLSDHFTIEAALVGLSYTNTSPDEGDSVGSTKIGFDTTDLTIGLKYIF